MTDEEKRQINIYRENGYGYKQISNITGLSINTIKSYCRRNKLKETDLNKKEEKSFFCEYCGKSIEQKEHRKRKRFCCDYCRNKWWNNHLELVKKKANYKITCGGCGKEFIVYGNAKRKYCCHECYIKHRFGGKKSG